MDSMHAASPLASLLSVRPSSILQTGRRQRTEEKRERRSMATGTTDDSRHTTGRTYVMVNAR